MATCKYCKENIADGAKKCKICGSSLTLLGRLIGVWIPIISVLIALISGVQTYNAQIEKEKAQEEKTVVMQEKIQVQSENQNLTRKLDSANSNIKYYEQSLTKVKEEVKELKNMNMNSNQYKRRLNSLSDDIDNYTKPRMQLY